VSGSGRGCLCVYVILINLMISATSPSCPSNLLTLSLDDDDAYDDDDDDDDDSQLEGMLAWFADPVFFGKYPDSMVSYLGEKLPKFTDEEAKLLKGSWDFFGLNHVSHTVNTEIGVPHTRITDRWIDRYHEYSQTRRPSSSRAPGTSSDSTT
jgi:beta-glucosidase/6-phospho-beta-glucosidase/beta-galactosidase